LEPSWFRWSRKKLSLQDGKKMRPVFHFLNSFSPWKIKKYPPNRQIAKVINNYKNLWVISNLGEKKRRSFSK
jgi:hypothetical protein